MSGKRTFVTLLCVFTIVCLFKSCGKYVIKHEDKVGYMLENPKEAISEMFEREPKEEEKDDFELAKERLYEALEEIKTK